MSNIKISILMPAYNSEEFISRSIESVIKQSFLNFELIIVDDGSRDATKEIVNMYKHNNNKIKLFTKSNSGITETLNFGLKKCKGEWIARLDSDDLSRFDRLEKQLLIAESNRNTGLVGSDAIFIDSLDNNLYSFSYPSTHKELTNNLLSCKKFFPHSSAFFNRELVESIGAYRQRAGISEDWDLWLRLASKSKIINIKKPLLKIRIHENRISNKNSLKQSFDTRFVIVANLLSTKKNYDPLDLLSDEEFINYKNYIEIFLEKLGFSDYLKFISFLKNPILKRIILPTFFLRNITRPFYIYSFIKLKFFSKSIQIKIAKSYYDRFIRNSKLIK
ncbi:Hypothetical protein P9515_13891 [Prochlorococcus marinus str. MIT 9515]|uniref:Glycosyltransferase 2-like domain-containing protein n=1 Tax=Prochlorococcus marinus (strain MIT 9515) TaxID=167542 RepID=A2BXT5_PROM5|nr:glycosyltransferase [Prochlorococcus marinus]ABM72596.1 Hypothetical protein P9515_13891 [Prochlorococcus marinus str. MIT 9515]